LGCIAITNKTKKQYVCEKTVGISWSQFELFFVVTIENRI